MVLVVKNQSVRAAPGEHSGGGEGLASAVILALNLVSFLYVAVERPLITRVCIYSLIEAFTSAEIIVSSLL
jgi:hypothetical protein